MKVVIKIVILLVLVLCGGAYYGLQQFQPTLDKLREKDQEKYDLMMAEAKSVIGFGTAQKIYEELNAMTPREVVDLHYRKQQKRLEEDKEFRDASFEEQQKIREQADIERKSRHELALQTLIRKPIKNKNDHAAEWQKSEPWQKSMILRKKCIKYLKLEQIDDQRRKNVLELSRVDSILERPKNTSWLIPEYCKSLFPDTNKNKTALKAMQLLKEKMNYFYYLKMLEEIGVSRDDLDFNQQLKGASNFFIDF